jgi:hypothetical protein
MIGMENSLFRSKDQTTSSGVAFSDQCSVAPASPIAVTAMPPFTVSGASETAQAARALSDV